MLLLHHIMNKLSSSCPPSLTAVELPIQLVELVPQSCYLFFAPEVKIFMLPFPFFTVEFVPLRGLI